MMKRPLVCSVVCMLVMVGMILSVSATSLMEKSAQPFMDLDESNLKNVNAGEMNYFDISEIAEVGQAAWGVTTADFNDDGCMDFAVASATSPFSHSRISIFYNDGMGGFTQQLVFTYIEYIDSLAAGDFNNDGAIDLLFGYSESDPEKHYAVYGTVSILFNEGNNNFGNATLIIKQGSGRNELFGRINPKISSGDYDLDGDIDFVLGDNSGKIELFSNQGAGSFISAGVIHDWGHLSWGVISADFDSDGDVDFLVSIEGTRPPHSSSVYLKRNRNMQNDLVPLFSKGRGELIAYPDVLLGSLAPLDYDNDGDMDFIAGDMLNLYLYIYDGGKYFPCSIGSLPDYEDLHMGAVASADFNNDGYTDFVAGGTQGVVRLFLNAHEDPFGGMITKPQERHLTIFDTTLPVPLLKRTMVVGAITLEAQTFGEVTAVDFYVDNNLEYHDMESPYTWVWDEHSLGGYTLKIVVWDDSGNSFQQFMSVWRFQHSHVLG